MRDSSRSQASFDEIILEQSLAKAHQVTK